MRDAGAAEQQSICNSKRRSQTQNVGEKQHPRLDATSPRRGKESAVFTNSRQQTAPNGLVARILSQVRVDVALSLRNRQQNVERLDAFGN